MPPRYLLDANLLVLLVVGLYDRCEIARHRRTESSFRAVDFDRVVAVLRSGGGLVVTPNVLTEASNLLGHGEDPKRMKLAILLRGIIEEAEEIGIPSRDAAGRAEFLRLGLADAGLVELALSGYTLLTADGPLLSAVLNAGGEAVHLSQLGL